MNAALAVTVSKHISVCLVRGLYECQAWVQVFCTNYMLEPLCVLVPSAWSGDYNYPLCHNWPLHSEIIWFYLISLTSFPFPVSPYFLFSLLADYFFPFFNFPFYVFYCLRPSSFLVINFTFCHFIISRHGVACPSDRAVYGVGLRPLALWDSGFESHRGHGCLSVSVVCRHVEVSATGWSLVQRSPTDCGAASCVI
jgi:hypothetical protein